MRSQTIKIPIIFIITIVGVFGLFSILNLDEDLIREEKEYYLYFYVDTCSACQQVKDEIELYQENGEIKLYKINMADDKYHDVNIEGTPTIWVIKKNLFGYRKVDEKIGVNEVLELISK